VAASHGHNICQTASSPHRLFIATLLPLVFRLHILRTVLFLHAALALPRTALPPHCPCFLFCFSINGRYFPAPVQSFPFIERSFFFTLHKRASTRKAPPIRCLIRLSPGQSLSRQHRKYPRGTDKWQAKRQAQAISTFDFLRIYTNAG